MGRSGSTLLGQLLANEFNAFDVGELRFVWQRGVLGNELCTCGLPFLECPFWTSVGEGLNGWQAREAEWAIHVAKQVQRIRTLRPVLSRRSVGGATDLLADYQHLLARLYRAVAEVAECDLLIDTSKDARYGAVLCGATDLDVRVLRLVRDSRAVAFSWSRTRVRPETATKELMPRYGPAEAAGRYLVQSLGGDALSHSGRPFLRVRYEDLVANVAPELGRIGEWLGRNRSPQAPLPDHSMSGNPMRFGAHPPVIVPDVEWQARMSRRARVAVAAVTWPLLWKYDYARPGSSDPTRTGLKGASSQGG